MVDVTDCQEQTDEQIQLENFILLVMARDTVRHRAPLQQRNDCPESKKQARLCEQAASGSVTENSETVIAAGSEQGRHGHPCGHP